MNPSSWEPREEMVQAEPLAAPPPIRYPQSAVRYPFLSLPESGPKPARSKAPDHRCPGAVSQDEARRTYPLVVAAVVVHPRPARLVRVDRREMGVRAHARVEPQKWRQLHERLAEAPDRPLLLMLGSSRSDWAFQAGRLNGQSGPDGRPLLAYNLAVPTTGPLHEALYLNDLLAEGIRPRLLLIELVTTHLNQSQRGLLSEEHFTMPEWHSAHQIVFMRPYFSNKRRMLMGWLESRLAPWYSFRSAVHDHLLGYHAQLNPYDQQAQPMDDWGWRMIYKDPNTPAFRAMRWACTARMYGESLKHFRLGPGPVQAMRDVMARCRARRFPSPWFACRLPKSFGRCFPKKAGLLWTSSSPS